MNLTKVFTSTPFHKHAPPRVRIHASREQAFELLKFLYRHQRLRLIPEEKIRKQFLCGAFGLVKDERKDRLILDARLPNLLENTLNSWTKNFGSNQCCFVYRVITTLQPHHVGH